MKTMLFAVVLLFAVNAQAAEKFRGKLVEACGGVKIDYQTKEVHSVKVKVIDPSPYLLERDLQVYVDEVLVVRQLVTVSVDNEGRHFETKTFQTREGIPTSMKLTIKRGERGEFNATGFLYEISFIPEVGSIDLSCVNYL